MKRRQFAQLAGATLAAPAFAWKAPNIEIGVTDWNLSKTGNIEALDWAKELGFAGIEVSLGRTPLNNKLPMDNQPYQEQYVKKSKALGMDLISTCLDILHVNGLKNDKLGQKWLGDAIEINRRMGIRNMLLPFFGQRQMETKAEMDYVGDLLREFGPMAAKANVILGIEDTNTAEDNVRIMERSRSSAVKVFYDVGNSHSRGYDIYKEIVWLGKDRICQFHLKDNPNYMGEGKIDFKRVFDSITQIGWSGHADLETSSPSKDVKADMTRNLAYMKKLMSA